MANPKQVEIEVWCKDGGMLMRTDCLPFSHPKHPWNQVKAKGLDPTHYGMIHPYEEEFKDKTRGELIAEIIQLREEITGRAFHGF